MGVQAVAEVPVVTLWEKLGPLLRTRRDRPVFTLSSIQLPDASVLRSHSWLAKPLPLFPGDAAVTSAPGMEDLLVRTRFRFSMRTRLGTVKETQMFHAVVSFLVGFRIAAFPETTLLDVPT